MLSKSYSNPSNWIALMLIPLLALQILGVSVDSPFSHLAWVQNRCSIPRQPCHATFLLYCSPGVLYFAQPLLRFFGLATSSSVMCALAFDHPPGAQSWCVLFVR